MFNQWELMSPMPEAVLHPAVAATNQRIYAFGGENAMQNPVRIIQVQYAPFLIISLRYGRVVVSPQSKRVVGSISAGVCMFTMSLCWCCLETPATLPPS